MTSSPTCVFKYIYVSFAGYYMYRNLNLINHIVIIIIKRSFKVLRLAKKNYQHKSDTETIKFVYNACRQSFSLYNNLILWYHLFKVNSKNLVNLFNY